MTEQKYDFYAALFSMLDGPLTQDEQEALAKVTASWLLLNHRNGRFLVDICGPKNQLVAIKNYLINDGRQPIVLGVWDCDNNLIQRGTAADWLNVAEDVVTYNPDGTVASVSRPTAFRSTHEFAGWAARTA